MKFDENDPLYGIELDETDHRLLSHDGIEIVNSPRCIARCTHGDTSYQIAPHALYRFYQRVSDKTRRMFPSFDLSRPNDALWAMYVLLSFAKHVRVYRETQDGPVHALLCHHWFFVYKPVSEPFIVTSYQKRKNWIKQYDPESPEGWTKLKIANGGAQFQ